MRLNGSGREKETVVGKRQYFIIERTVPIGENIHVIIEEYDVVGFDLGAHHVQGKANTNVFLAEGIVKALLSDPFQGTVATLVDMDDNLMVVGRMAFDALHAELQERQVIPRGNEYGEEWPVGWMNNSVVFHIFAKVMNVLKTGKLFQSY